MTRPRSSGSETSQRSIAASPSRKRARSMAALRGVPVLTIRGRYDPSAPVDRIDHAYPGGHDITLREHFEEAMAAVAAFLGGLTPAE